MAGLFSITACRQLSLESARRAADEIVYTFGLKIPMAAPCESCSTAMRPTSGTSDGGMTTLLVYLPFVPRECRKTPPESKLIAATTMQICLSRCHLVSSESGGSRQKQCTVLIIDRCSMNIGHSAIPPESRISNQQVLVDFARLQPAKRGEPRHDSGIKSALLKSLVRMRLQQAISERKL